MANQTATMAVFTVCCVCCWLFFSPPAAADATAADLFQECQQQQMDVVFLQDSSYSVGNDSFSTAKDFLVRIVRQLPVGPHLVRVALIRFGTYADVIAGLTQSTDVTAVTRAIQGMEYKTGGTQTGRALRTVRQQVLSERRTDVRAVVVVITDGNSMKLRETRTEARRLRGANVRLIWLYISASDTDSEALGRERNYMADQGDTTLVADSFEALGEQARMQILNASCKEDPEPETTTADPATPATITTSPPSSPAVRRIKPTTIPPLPVSTESDADVTDPVTSSSDEKETTGTPEATPVEAVTSFTPTTSTTTSSPAPLTEAKTEKTLVQDLSSETTLSPARDPSSASGTSATEPATSEPPASTSGTTREEKSKAQTTSRDDSGSSNNKASTGERGQEEEEKAWHQSLENIVGVTVGGFAVVALTSGCVYYAAWRRRKDKREKAQRKQDP